MNAFKPRKLQTTWASPHSILSSPLRHCFSIHVTSIRWKCLRRCLLCCSFQRPSTFLTPFIALFLQTGGLQKSVSILIYHTWFIFTCLFPVFGDTVSNSEYKPLNKWMSSEKWKGKNVEGSDCGLVWCNIPCLDRLEDHERSQSGLPIS
jgi:hypothetical protein